MKDYDTADKNNHLSSMHLRYCSYGPSRQSDSNSWVLRKTISHEVLGMNLLGGAEETAVMRW